MTVLLHKPLASGFDISEILGGLADGPIYRRRREVMGKIRTFGHIDKKVGEDHVEIEQPVLLTNQICSRLLPPGLMILPKDKLPMLIG